MEWTDGQSGRITELPEASQYQVSVGTCSFPARVLGAPGTVDEEGSVGLVPLEYQCEVGARDSFATYDFGISSATIRWSPDYLLVSLSGTAEWVDEGGATQSAPMRVSFSGFPE